MIKNYQIVLILIKQQDVGQQQISMTKSSSEENQIQVNQNDRRQRPESQKYINFDIFFQQFYDDQQQSPSEKIQQEFNSSSDIVHTSSLQSSVGKSQEKKKRNRKKSAYHNFQKHLVTTVRRHLKIRYLRKKGNAPAASIELWSIFHKEKVYTKQFLQLVIGECESYEKTKYLSLIKKYKLLPIYEKYEKDELMEAQKFLKEQVVEMFQELDDKKITYKRRIQKEPEFINYLRQFIRDIEREERIQQAFPKNILRTEEFKDYNNRQTKMHQKQQSH